MKKERAVELPSALEKFQFAYLGLTIEELTVSYARMCQSVREDAVERFLLHRPQITTVELSLVWCMRDTVQSFRPVWQDYSFRDVQQVMLETRVAYQDEIERAELIITALRQSWHHDLLQTLDEIKWYEIKPHYTRNFPFMEEPFTTRSPLRPIEE